MSRLLGSRGGSFDPRYTSAAELLFYLGRGLVKDAGNPIFAKGTASAWDDFAVRELTPVVDELGHVVTEADGIWAYYWGRPDGGAGTFQIGLAKSTDNGVAWTRYGSNPIISPAGTSWYETSVSQPSTVKRSDGTRVMLAGGGDVGGISSIGCFTSPDGLAWTDAGQKLVLTDFLDGATPITQIGVPNLIKRSSGDWLVIVEARLTAVTNGWRVWGATATNPAGTWTVLNSGQPLLSPTGSDWESVGVANAHVIETRPSEYLMAYNGIGSVSPNWQIGFATSTNLTTWTRHVGNPVLSKGASGAWDDQQTEVDALVKEPYSGTLRLYYQGYSAVDGSMQVGLAVA